MWNVAQSAGGTVWRLVVGTEWQRLPTSSAALSKRESAHIPIIVEWFKTEKEARAFVTKTFGEYSNRAYRNVLMWTRPKRTKAKKRKD